MPWTLEDVGRFNKGLDDKQKSVWVSVANRTLANLIKEGVDDKEADGKAVRAANAAVSGMKDNAIKINEDTPIMIRHLMSKLVRKEMYDGREHLAVPTILITEGVHNNILYTSDEMKKHAESWNGRPVVLWHPETNGRPVSAGSPTVLERQMLGTVFNTQYDEWTNKGKRMKGLKAEVWFDKAKLEANGPEVFKMLAEEKPIEVSTGLFTDDVAPVNNENGAAKWNEETYDLLATNYRPDHLAILPGGKGACSWADGAGMPRVNEDLFPSVELSDTNRVQNQNKGENMDRKKEVDALIKLNKGWVPEDAKFLEEVDEAVFLKINAAAAKGCVDDEEELDENGKPIKKNPFKKNEAPKTLEQLVAEAPADFRETLQYGIQAHRARKAELVAGIKANKKNTFTDEVLSGKSMAELEAIHALAAVTPAADMSGRSTAVKVNADPNAVEPMPVHDWTKKQ